MNRLEFFSQKVGNSGCVIVGMNLLLFDPPQSTQTYNIKGEQTDLMISLILYDFR